MNRTQKKNIEIIKKLLPGDVYVGTGTNGHFDLWLGVRGLSSAYVYEFIEATQSTIKNINKHIEDLRKIQKIYLERINKKHV